MVLQPLVHYFGILQMTIGLRQKDLEHKILLENGDSIISGSGTNNQITTFTGTHGVDSSKLNI